VGDGIYVNYLFALVWLADAGGRVWRSSRPAAAAVGEVGGVRVPAFIAINAGVVFNSGFGRAVCAVLFVAALVTDVARRERRAGA
jgi:hypothetical protein